MGFPKTPGCCNSARSLSADSRNRPRVSPRLLLSEGLPGARPEAGEELGFLRLGHQKPAVTVPACLRAPGRDEFTSSQQRPVAEIAKHIQMWL